MVSSKQVILSRSGLLGYSKNRRLIRNCKGIERFYCPIHGGDNQHSFVITWSTGHFHCYCCHCWGYIEEKRIEFVKSRRHAQTFDFSDADESGISDLNLRDRLKELQKSFPGSRGEAYLTRRGIPLEIAQRMGVGLARAGQWPGWKEDRIVFPLTNPMDQVLNINGRRFDRHCPHKDRYRKLKGGAGIFNAKALRLPSVIICEGEIDALSMMAGGYRNVCALAGNSGLFWNWVQAKYLQFGFDADTGGQEWRTLCLEARKLGKTVSFLDPRFLRGCKDLNELWVRHGIPAPSAGFE